MGKYNPFVWVLSVQCAVYGIGKQQSRMPAMLHIRIFGLPKETFQLHESNRIRFLLTLKFMKTVYLVRHAKSSWDFPQLSDHDRPLNGRGKQAAPEMGKRLASRDILPDQLISSTAKRARRTAYAIAKEIGYEKKDIIKTKYLYHAGEEEMLSLVRRQHDDISSLMLFGHNPSFTYFANQLAGVSIENIPTSGVVAVEFDTDSWDSIRFGQGKLVFFDYPKKPFETSEPKQP